MLTEPSGRPSVICSSSGRDILSPIVPPPHPPPFGRRATARDGAHSDSSPDTDARTRHLAGEQRVLKESLVLRPRSVRRWELVERRPGAEGRGIQVM